MRTPLLALSILLLALPGCPTPEPKPDPGAVSAVIGPEGGTLSHPAGAVLVVPPGALQASVSLSMAAAQAPSSGVLRATPLGSAFVLGPEGQGFARPVELTLPFDPARVPAGVAAPRIFTAPSGSNEFVQLETTAAASTVTAATLHFSTFVPAAPMAASALSITTGSPLPSGVVGTAYGPVFLQASGGTPPYTWLLSWGSLPQGITLSTLPDGRGELQGLPGNAGDYAFAVRVSDSAGQITEAPFELRIASASDVSITGVVPPQIPVRSGDTLVTVSGTGFAVGSVVLLDGRSLPTTFVSATSLTAIVPASALTTVGTRRLQVSNALINGGVSAPFSLLVINAPPVLTSMSPPEIPAGHPTMRVTLTGSNFAVGAQAYLGAVALPTAAVSPTEAVITVSANLLVNPGTFSLTLTNPAPGGGTSAPLPFRVVTLPPPTVLASSASTINLAEGHLTVDDVSVYWTDHTVGTLSRVPINGGAVTVIESPGTQVHQADVAVGRCNVYWLHASNLLNGRRAELMSVPVNGGTPGRALSMPRELNLVRYDGVSGEVYFSTGPDVGDTIFRIPATGGTPVEVISSTWIQDFELDDTALYLLSRGTGSSNFFNGGVYRLPRDGSAGAWLSFNQNDPRHLAVGADRVYWTLASGEILSVARTGVGGVSMTIRTGAPIRSLTVDANHLYWTSDHDVLAMPLSGGPAVILASATDSWPQALRVDGAFLYWLNRNGQVLRLAKPGGSGGPPATGACAGNPGHPFPVPLSNVGGFGGIVSDGSFVYWSDGQGSGQGSIYKLPVSGGAHTTLATGHDQPFTLRLFNGQLYWPDFYRGIMSMPASGASPAVQLWAWGTLDDLEADSSGVWWVSSRTQQLLRNGVVVSTYTNDPPIELELDTNDVYTRRFITDISRQPKSGGPSVEVVNNNGNVGQLVNSGGFLYWMTDVSINRMPLAGGPVETRVIGQQYRARSLVVDGSELYWLTDGVFPDYGNGRVRFLRWGVGTPITLAEAQTAPSSITVDAQNVYWINGGTSTSPGAVMKLAKSTLP